MFCPRCANLLLIQQGLVGFQFYCQTCPYVYTLTEKIKNVVASGPKKQVKEHVIGGSEDMEHLDQTTSTSLFHR